MGAVPELDTRGALTRLWDHLKKGQKQRLYGWFQEWADIEAQATVLGWYEPLVVPGLLQTGDYARAILSARPDGNLDDLDEQVAAPSGPQAILDRTSAPQLWCILDELLARLAGLGQTRVGQVRVPHKPLAMAYRAQNRAADDLLVIDGPLRSRTHLDRTLGHIKTRNASYLPPEQAAVVSALPPGQRTPAFAMGTSWRRTSWYLQLPRISGVPWSGVVRLECSANLPVTEVTRLGDLTARLLPLASVPLKDPRASQNLVPIGALERELRHRLGDQQVLYRALRAAAAGPPGGEHDA